MTALLIRALTDVVWASWLGACIAGDCSLGETLARIARRESGGQLIGIHEADAWAGPVAWRNAVRVGLLSADCQPRGDGRRWATRGVHGQIGAYGVPYLWRCASPVWLSVPLVSAVAAARRARSRACGRVARCRSWLGRSA